MDQPKLDRLLRLMKMLTGNTTYSIDELAERLETTERTIYRYIDTFREAGFVLKKKGNIFRIDKSSPYFKDISSLIHFTEEEAYILKSAIENIDENNLIKQNLKKKLYTVYDYKILAETTVKGKNAENVNRLIEAFHDKKQVLLRNYSSANSHVVRDRLIEPFAFTSNYIQLWAFEPESGKNKLFKLSRVFEVVIQADSWRNETSHHAGYLDCFRLSSQQQYLVKLKLGLRAATLLTEEYPLAEKDLVRISDNLWTFDTKVCNYEGIGRFVIGLLQDIEIVDSPEFAYFIQTRIENGLESLKKIGKS